MNETINLLSTLTSSDSLSSGFFVISRSFNSTQTICILCDLPSCRNNFDTMPVEKKNALFHPCLRGQWRNTKAKTKGSGDHNVQLRRALFTSREVCTVGSLRNFCEKRIFTGGVRAGIFSRTPDTKAVLKALIKHGILSGEEALYRQAESERLPSNARTLDTMPQCDWINIEYCRSCVLSKQ